MAEIQTLRDSLRAVRAENERLRSGAAARRKAEEALRAALSSAHGHADDVTVGPFQVELFDLGLHGLGLLFQPLLRQHRLDRAGLAVG